MAVACEPEVEREIRERDPGLGDPPQRLPQAQVGAVAVEADPGAGPEPVSQVKRRDVHLARDVPDLVALLSADSSSYTWAEVFALASLTGSAPPPARAGLPWAPNAAATTAATARVSSSSTSSGSGSGEWAA